MNVVENNYFGSIDIHVGSLNFDHTSSVLTWNIFRILNSTFSHLFLQLSFGVSSFLRHHHSAQLVAAPGRIQDGSAASWRPSENGGSAAEEQQCQVPGHHDRLSADPGLWEPREQGNAHLSEVNTNQIYFSRLLKEDVACKWFDWCQIDGWLCWDRPTVRSL